MLWKLCPPAKNEATLYHEYGCSYPLGSPSLLKKIKFFIYGAILKHNIFISLPIIIEIEIYIWGPLF